MTVTGGADQPSRADREPPSFPRVAGSEPLTDPGSAGASPPPFSAVGAGGQSNRDAEVSPIVSTQREPGQRRGNRLRWLVAGLATVLVFGLVGGVLFLATPRAGSPSAMAHYVPAGTGMYAEFRLDLPGDQRANLAAFMSHFPGFADQAAFQQKLDETLNSVLTKSGTGVDWNNDVKPWFGGTVALFGDPSPPAPVGSSGQDTISAAPDVVIAFTVSDRQKLQAVIDAHAGGSQLSPTDYQGQTIYTLAQPAGMSRAVSYVVTDDALLVAPAADLLKAALDVKQTHTDALADQAFFLQQLGALHADRLGTFYYDTGKQIAAMNGGTGAIMPASCTQMYQGAASAKYVGELRAETDHLTMTSRSQVPSGGNAPAAPVNRSTTLAQSMPSDTLFYLESRNFGQSAGWLIKNWLACTSSVGAAADASPSASFRGGLGDVAQTFEQLMGVKPGDYLDFVDDLAIGVSLAGTEASGGIIATVNDEATATSRVGKLLGLAKLGGGFGGDGSSSGPQITTSEADHNGIKVTTIKLASPAAGDKPLSFQVAVGNGRLYLGLNDFVTAALDRAPTDSLGSSARYQHAIALKPGDNAGIAYVDIPLATAAIEARMSGTQRTTFETDTKPFLDPLSSFSMINHVDGGTVVSDAFLFVE